MGISTIEDQNILHRALCDLTRGQTSTSTSTLPHAIWSGILQNHITVTNNSDINTS